MAAPSIRTLASGAGLPSENPAHNQANQSLAQQVLSHAQLLLPQSPPLDVPLGPATYDIMTRLRGSRGADADALKEATLSLRGVYSMMAQCPMGEPYPEDVPTADFNETSIPLFIVPELHQHGLGPAVWGEETTADPTLPLRGILFGSNLRPIVNMIFEFKGRKVQLPVLVDMASQATCLNKHSWKLLSPDQDTSTWTETTSEHIKVHGVTANVYLSRGRNAGVNVVGQDWLNRAGAMFVVGYACQGCVILEDSAANRGLVPSLHGIAE